MPKISVIIPTHNRPNLLKKAIASVLAQSRKDFEIIVVDDGLKDRAEFVVNGFNDPRISYIRHETQCGGAAARNTGIRNSHAPFVAFLDDDDEWLPEKLEVQMDKFENSNKHTGFCFSAVEMISGSKIVATRVPDGEDNYLQTVLSNLNGFLTVTLMVKRYVFDDVGMFDESLPSHQDPDLVIRISKSYNGLGINKPLVIVNMDQSREHIGGDNNNKIKGRRIILEKYMDEYKKIPKLLARNYFEIGLMFRDERRWVFAREYFAKALGTRYNSRHFLHYMGMTFSGLPYRLFKSILK